MVRADRDQLLFSHVVGGWGGQQGKSEPGPGGGRVLGVPGKRFRAYTLPTCGGCMWNPPAQRWRPHVGNSWGSGLSLRGPCKVPASLVGLRPHPPPQGFRLEYKGGQSAILLVCKLRLSQKRGLVQVTGQTPSRTGFKMDESRLGQGNYSPVVLITSYPWS